MNNTSTKGEEMIDYRKISGALAEALEKAGEPLSEEQKIMITVGLAVWIDKFEKEIISEIHQAINNA